ncbi:methyl-accepting chemotaxis protein [Thermosulfuriphilus sp.]
MNILGTIKGRLTLVVLAMFTISLINFGVIFFVLKKNSQDAVAVNLAGRQRMLSQKMTKQFLEGDFAGARETMALFEKSLRALRKGDGELNLSNVKDPQIMAQIERLERVWVEFKAHLEKLLNGQGTEEDRRYILSHNLELLSEANKLTKLFEEKSVQGLQQLKTYQAAIFGLTLVILGLILWSINVSVVRPVERALSVVERLAKGDFTVEFPPTSKDEIGRLLGALKMMAQELRGTLKEVRGSSEKVSSSAETVNQAGLEVASTAKRLSREAEEVQIAEESVSNNIQAVSDAAQEMVAAITEISQNTSQAAQVANEAMVKAQNTNEVVSKLSLSSKEIGEVVKLINQIAEQTNLLALNATIEAARAGEAGKGFAVVANEVKELAKQTAKATEEISQKIQAIQSDAEASVQAIEEITAIVSQINDISNTIASAVEEQTATMGEISQSISQAAESTENIKQKIDSMAQAVEETAKKGEESQLLSQELTALATKLKDVVSQFRC